MSDYAQYNGKARASIYLPSSGLMLEAFYGTGQNSYSYGTINDDFVTFTPGFGFKLGERFALGFGGIYSHYEQTNTMFEKLRDQDRSGAFVGAFWTPGDYLSFGSRPAVQFLVDETAGSNFTELEANIPVSADFLLADRKLLLQVQANADLLYDSSWNLGTTYSAAVAAEYWVTEGFSILGIGAGHWLTSFSWSASAGFSARLFAPATIYITSTYDSSTETTVAVMGMRAFVDFAL